MYSKKASFASGELDPSLHDKTDIKSYYSGLKTALNVFISKTGRLVNFPGTWFLNTTLNSDENVRIYVPENLAYLLEFGVGYVRAYDLTDLETENYRNNAPSATTATDYTADDLIKLKFETVQEADDADLYWVYVACKDKNLEAFYFDGTDVIRRSKYIETYVDNTARDAIAAGNRYVSMKVYISSTGNIYQLQGGILNANWVLLQTGLAGYYGVDVTYPAFKNAPTITMNYNDTQANMLGRVGHSVIYGVTCVTIDGQESLIRRISSYTSTDSLTSTYVRLPTGTQSTVFTINDLSIFEPKYAETISHFNVYRKPNELSAPGSSPEGWGLIGQVSNNVGDLTGLAIDVEYIDYGQDADYTNPPPGFSVNEKFIENSTLEFYKVTNLNNYNSRLMLMDDDVLFASRVNTPNYFLRDFPLTDATPFNLKVSVNKPRILHVLDASGLIIFTTKGVWYGGSDEPLSSLNPLIRKIGNWISDENIPPMLTPYGVLFVDKTTNSIKTLSFDDNIKSMVATDISLYNNHLFYGKKVKSWSFLNGDNPVLFVVMDDGTALTLTYEPDAQLLAWTKHNTDGKYESVITYREDSTGLEYLIVVVNRQGVRTIETFSKRILLSPETLRTFSHSSLSFQLVNGVPVIVSLALFEGGWDEDLKYEGPVGTYFTSRIGKTFIAYTEDRKERVYLELISAVAGGPGEVVFRPDRELPESLRSPSVPVNIEIFECHTQVTGLEHLEGREVSVIGDGDVLSSPNNNIEHTTILTVGAGGILNLPDPKHITVVGLPYTSDVETLEIDSKDGSLSLDSKIVNDVVVRYSRTRGAYVSGVFPTDGKVQGMEDADMWSENDQANMPIAEKVISRRYRPYSDWGLNGKVCVRQVDPLPLEIVSLILDVST